MEMQQVTVHPEGGYGTDGTQELQVSKGVTTMQRITHLVPTTRTGLGLIVASALAIATLVSIFLTTRPAFSTQAAPLAPVNVQPNYSHVPEGLLSYQRLQQNALPYTNHSQPPADLADRQRLQDNAIGRTNHSKAPIFMTEHQPKVERPETNFSPLPMYAQDHVKFEK